MQVLLALIWLSISVLAEEEEFVDRSGASNEVMIAVSGQMPTSDGSIQDTSATLIGDNRLPTMQLEEFSVASGGNLGAVLRTMARLADVNMVFSDRVDSMPSLSFKMNKPTPWNDVFEGILKVHHLSYLQGLNMIRIMTIKDMAQEYAMQEAIARQTTLKANTRRVQPLVLAVVDIKYAKAESLIDVLREVLEKSESHTIEMGKKSSNRGSVSSDVVNNNIIINAIQSDVDKLVELTQKMDQPTRQVRIEANIVEVSSTFARELGVKWNGEFKHKDNNTETLANVERSTPDGYGVLDATFDRMTAGLDPATGVMRYGILTEDFSINTELKALEKAGKIKVLSRPSITTLDNMTARIKSGQSVPFSTVDDEGNSVVEFVEAVLLLEVTPHMIDDDTLTMDILTRKDAPDFSVNVEGNPLIHRKEAKTHLILNDGETTVIAGLSKNNLANSNSGIPILKNIPIIGYLFKYKSRADNNEEMMIFITPRIVDETLPNDTEQIEKWVDETYGESLIGAD